VIRIDALWLAFDPVDMRAGPDRLLASVVQVFWAARAHSTATCLPTHGLPG
jgi:transposase